MEWREGEVTEMGAREGQGVRGRSVEPLLSTEAEVLKQVPAAAIAVNILGRPGC